MRVRSLNLTEFNALIFRNQKQKNIQQNHDLLVQPKEELEKRPVASFACSVARGLVHGGERESSHFVRGIDWGEHERG